MTSNKVKKQPFTATKATNSTTCGISNFTLISLANKSVNASKLIATLINNHNCKIMHSQILELGEDLTFNALIYGKWNEIVKLEQAIYELSAKYSIHIYIKRNNTPIITTDQNIEHNHKKNLLEKNYINYAVHATSLNTPMLFYKLFNFFDKYQIPIKSAIINTNPDNYNLITLELHLKISTDVHIMSLRESFLNLCDNLNLDTSLEPL